MIDGVAMASPRCPGRAEGNVFRQTKNPRRSLDPVIFTTIDASLRCAFRVARKARMRLVDSPDRE